MATPVTYELEGEIATITMDDGKVNALSPEMLSGVDAALDRAAGDRAPVVLTGRDAVFSAGFHLPTLRGGGPEARDMVRAGFELAVRMLSFPMPVVIACPGHAIAMAVFLLQSGDYRVGAGGPYMINAEVYAPDEAVEAGFLDRVVPPSELDATARQVARELGELDPDAHAATKLAARDEALRAIRAGIEADNGGLRTSA